MRICISSLPTHPSVHAFMKFYISIQIEFQNVQRFVRQYDLHRKHVSCVWHTFAFELSLDEESMSKKVLSVTIT